MKTLTALLPCRLLPSASVPPGGLVLLPDSVIVAALEVAQASGKAAVLDTLAKLRAGVVQFSNLPVEEAAPAAGFPQPPAPAFSRLAAALEPLLFGLLRALLRSFDLF